MSKGSLSWLQVQRPTLEPLTLHRMRRPLEQWQNLGRLQVGEQLMQLAAPRDLGLEHDVTV